MTESLDVTHNEHVSDRSYDRIVEAFYAATGNAGERLDDVLKDLKNRAEFEAEFSSREGTSGFMRFLVVDHGDWLTRFYDQPAKAVLAVIGNPLIAITMLEGDLDVGLNVPTRIYIRACADGRTRVTYDLPSSLMGPLPERTRAAALKLDTKMVELATSISGVGPCA